MPDGTGTFTERGTTVSDDQPKRKVRTREHIIADLGVNFVERQILLAGFTPERYRYDYGLDLVMKTFDGVGQVEAGSVGFQVKATDHFTPHANGSAVSVRVDLGNLKGWLLEWTPIALVLYDARAERAYWIIVQDYAQERDFDIDAAGATVSLAIPLANVFDVAAVRHLRDVKEDCNPPLPPVGPT